MPTEAISRLGIAYVPQRENIFDELTVRENLQLGARSAVRLKARAAALKELLEIYSRSSVKRQIAKCRPAQRRRTSDAGDRNRLAQPTADHAVGRAERRLWRRPSPWISSGPCKTCKRRAARPCRPVSVVQHPRQPITLVVVEQNARRIAAILRLCLRACAREGAGLSKAVRKTACADEETIKGYLGVH